MQLYTATVKNVNRAFKQIPLFEEWEGEYQGAMQRALKELMEGRLHAEVSQYLGREWYAHADAVRDYRNGSYERHLLTSVGDVLLEVPRVRSGPFLPQILPAYARRARSVDRVILSCFILGLSTRKAASVLMPMLGEKISASTVSEIAKSLDWEVTRYHERKLEDRYRFLFLDGVVLKHRGPLKVSHRVLLCAYGITQEGIREMIDFQVAASESENAWRGFLEDLYRRGLMGKTTELILTDGGKGLHAALEIVYPRIDLQRCWAHKSRNVLDKVKKADQEAVKKGIAKIWGASSRKEATEAYGEWASQWRQSYPQAVDCLAKDLPDLLTFYQVKDSTLWSRIRTTNAIERAFREVRRRTRPMGVFNNKQSIERIVFAIFYHLNQQWSLYPKKKFTHNS